MNYNHSSIKIETPGPNRYIVRGFPGGTTYVEGVGHLPPPDQIDLVMTDDLAGALEHVLRDYRKEQLVAQEETPVLFADEPSPANRSRDAADTLVGGPLPSTKAEEHSEEEDSPTKRGRHHKAVHVKGGDE